MLTISGHGDSSIMHYVQTELNSEFTLPQNENETDTANKYTEPNENLCCHPSLCSVNIFTQITVIQPISYLSRYRSWVA